MLKLWRNDDVVVFHKGVILSPNNSSRKGNYEISCRLPKQFFNAGIYKIKLIFGESQRYLLYEADAFMSFEVMQEMAGSNSGRLPGLTFPELEFTVKQP